MGGSSHVRDKTPPENLKEEWVYRDPRLCSSCYNPVAGHLSDRPPVKVPRKTIRGPVTFPELNSINEPVQFNASTRGACSRIP